MSHTLPYAIISPVRDEAAHLPRLATCVRAQSERPQAWVIVDGGSDDETVAVARSAAQEEPWIHVLSSDQARGRGGPVVRAFNEGIAKLDSQVDVIVKLDADVSVHTTYFEELLGRFSANPRLGIASGTCLELQNGRWLERHVTADNVWGPCRAYRAHCLAEVSPLEERMGWDGIDVLKAGAYGWWTETFRDLPFRHHRPEGGRERSSWKGWRLRGEAMHYMGSRPVFVLARTLHKASNDPAAVGLAYGWVAAAVRGESQVADSAARAALRRQQRLRELPARIREARGKRHRPAPIGSCSEVGARVEDDPAEAE